MANEEGSEQAGRPAGAQRAERAKEEVLSERDDILARVRRGALRRAAHPGPHPAPALPGGWEVFAAMLARVGGEAHGPFAPHTLGAALAALVRLRAGGGRCVAEPSAAELAGRGPFEIARTPAAPHGFADVSVAIVRGHSAAADCAAVVLLERDAPNRALPFLCQRLVLLLPVAALHPDLHSAWAALPESATRGHHVTWISGPSKTADIEQTLVYGAHGPLGLDVVGIAD